MGPEWQLQRLRQLCWTRPSHRQLPHVQRSPSLTDRSCLGVATAVGGEESWREDESSAETHIHSLSPMVKVLPLTRDMGLWWWRGILVLGHCVLTWQVYLSLRVEARNHNLSTPGL